MIIRFKCRYPATSRSSALRSHSHKAVLGPAALTPAFNNDRSRRHRRPSGATLVRPHPVNPGTRLLCLYLTVKVLEAG